MFTGSLYLLAFLSGFAALVYQVAWAKMLSLTFGSSTLAVSSVVAGFLGGMGIGAWLYRRVSDRGVEPLRSYSALEFGIALSTAIFTLFFRFLPGLFAATAGILPAGLVMDAFRALSAIVLLLVPSVLMGATYPALCTALIHTRSGVERHLGWIYGFNTLGGAAGAMVAGLAMIELLGSSGAVLSANAINIVVAVSAFLMARGKTRAGRVARASTSDESLPSELPVWLTGIVLFVSGFTTLGYEIVWFRALRYLVGNGTYVLTNVLVIFLLGLGFGGFFYRAALRLGRAESNLALCQLGISILALLAIGCEQLVLTTPWLRDQLSIFSVEFRSHSWPWRLGVSSAVSLAIMLPATLWMGLSFPLASRLFLGSMRALGSRVGLAYLISNLGSILGAVMAAVFIIPRLGTVDGTRLLAGLNLALGLLIASRAPSGRALYASALAAVVFALGIGFVLPDRLDFRGESWLGMPDPRRLFEEEAELGTVQVLAQRGTAGERAMSIDGVPIGVTPGYDRDLYAKQVLLAHLPMLLDREIRDTLNVGVATASTLDAVSRYPWVETLDAVEINASVIRAASLFPYAKVFQDPRVGIEIEDAVHYLLRTSRTYDLIINDAKQDVEFAGNAKILSREFYEHSLARLERCGLFAQWIPLTSSAEAFEMIGRTFIRVFPQVEFFVDPPTSAIMVGSRCPIAGRRRPTPVELEKLGIAAELRSISLPDPLELLTLWAASGADLRAHLGPGPLNSWDRMRLEFIAYRAARTGPKVIAAAAGNLRLLAEARKNGSGETPEFADASLLQAMFRLQEAWVQILGGRLAEARTLINGVLEERPDHAPARKAARVVSGARADGM